MHEASIVQALFDRIEVEARAHGARAVCRVSLSIGELAGVEVDLLRTAYETFRERTVCAGAVLDVHPVAATWCCPLCGRELEPGAILRCPTCGVPARLAGGDEIVLERLEMEVG